MSKLKVSVYLLSCNCDHRCYGDKEADIIFTAVHILQASVDDWGYLKWRGTTSDFDTLNTNFLPLRALHKLYICM